MNGGGTDWDSSLGLGGLLTKTNSRMTTPESRAVAPTDMTARFVARVLDEGGATCSGKLQWPGWFEQSLVPQPIGARFRPSGAWLVAGAHTKVVGSPCIDVQLSRNAGAP